MICVLLRALEFLFLTVLGVVMLSILGQLRNKLGVDHRSRQHARECGISQHDTSAGCKTQEQKEKQQGQNGGSEDD